MQSIHPLSRNVIAHRGFWKGSQEQNGFKAIKRAIDCGFGLELDLRDSLGEIFISHDPVLSTDGTLRLKEITSLLDECKGSIAFNIKSDGLLDLLHGTNPKLNSADHFYFDMSTPQLISFARAGFPLAVRISDWEPFEVGIFRGLNLPVRVWLDSFDSDWWVDDSNVRRLAFGGEVIMVSPEIHGRDPRVAWQWAKEVIEKGGCVSICTDLIFESLEAIA